MTGGQENQPLGLLILSKVLRQLRTGAGLTQDQLAKKINYARSQVSNTEQGREMPSADFLEACDRHFGTGRMLVEIRADAMADGLPAWAAAYVDAEAQAVGIRSFQPLVFPGLVQTRRYASALLNAGLFGDGDPDRLEEVVAQRLNRQAILHGERLRSFHVILGQAVLYQVVGSTDIVQEQVAHLLDLMRQRTITLQVLPYAASAFGPSGPMAVFDLEDRSQVVHLEQPVGSLTTADAGTLGECVKRFDLLRSQAESLQTSGRMIEQRLEELESL